MPIPLAITTSANPDGATLQRARDAARRFGLPLLPRPRKASFEPLLEQADALLIHEHDGVTLRAREAALQWSPGIAHLRIKRLDAGVLEDTYLRIAELRPGEHVLDCTLGLAQDALVAARAVGPQGRVVGLEKALPLFLVTSEGLARHDPGERSCKVEPLHADAATYLPTLPDRSFDVVFFDPMFEKPRQAQPGFDVLRRFADYAPLSPELLEQARRVARRRIIVKGSRYSADLKKLGLEPVVLSRFADVAWGVVDVR